LAHRRQLHNYSVVAGRFKKDIGPDRHADVANVLMRQSTERYGHSLAVHALAHKPFALRHAPDIKLALFAHSHEVGRQTQRVPLATRFFPYSSWYCGVGALIEAAQLLTAQYSGCVPGQ
jgi:hypothetical protein